MTWIDVATSLFVASHLLRLLAYVPQIALLLRAEDRAGSVSVSSWGMFAASNFATALYAVLVLHDLGVLLAFGFNCACCLVIIALAVRGRRRGVRPGRRRAHLSEKIWS